MNFNLLYRDIHVDVFFVEILIHDIIKYGMHVKMSNVLILVYMTMSSLDFKLSY